ncbi:unnamed protein product [Polarella glacialis]|uniref:Alpha-ketoglutarate-dependent dioxygenase AlkB-like domain-containing protein n=1 Tax=Polarella glacialis TaxID=89957 RepID=A0A813FZJ1_POLGL|nr:unnamed protein product [Polarella glacialis]
MVPLSGKTTAYPSMTTACPSMMSSHSGNGHDCFLQPVSHQVAGMLQPASHHAAGAISVPSLAMLRFEEWLPLSPSLASLATQVPASMSTATNGGTHLNGQYEANSLVPGLGQGLLGSPAKRGQRDPAERRASQRRVAPHTWDATEKPELSVTELPLVLLSDLITQKPAGTAGSGDSSGSNHRLLLWDEGRRCFASHWPRVLPADFCAQSFSALLEHGPWQELLSKKGQVTRETCWYVRGGCRCDYTYGTARVQAKKKPSPGFREAMEQLLEEVCRRVCPGLPRDSWPNCANLNLYSEACQSVGWHADDESLFMGKEKDCPIISVSLGVKREFWLALRHEGDCMDPHLKSIIEVDLCDGDVMSMEGLCQKHLVHFVPCDMRNHPEPASTADQSSAPSSSRINVTWRWIRDHKLKCPRRVPPVSELRELRGAKVFCDQPGSASPLVRGLFILQWAAGRPLAWRTCDGCEHDAWRGGRNCVRHQKLWLCRHCLQHLRSGGKLAPSRPRPRPGERLRGDEALVQQRAEAERMRAMTSQSCVNVNTPQLCGPFDGRLPPQGCLPTMMDPMQRQQLLSALALQEEHLRVLRLRQAALAAAALGAVANSNSGFQRLPSYPPPLTPSGYPPMAPSMASSMAPSMTSPMPYEFLGQEQMIRMSQPEFPPCPNQFRPLKPEAYMWPQAQESTQQLHPSVSYYSPQFQFQ